MIKKVSIIALTLAISLDSVMVYAGNSKAKHRQSNKKRANAIAKVSKTKTKDVVQQTVEITSGETSSSKDSVKAPVSENAPAQAPTKVTIIDNSVTNDLDAIRSAVRDEIQANNQTQEQANLIQANELLAKVEASNKEKANQKIKEATAVLSQKINEVRSECSGIKSNIDTIFGLTVATTVSSGLGTAAAGGALAVGLVKSSKDKKAEEQDAANAERNYDEDYKEWKKKLDEVYTDTEEPEKLKKYSKLLSRAKVTKDLLLAVNQENKDLDRAIVASEKDVKMIEEKLNPQEKLQVIEASRNNQEALSSAMTASLTSINTVTKDQYTAAASQVKDTKTLGNLRTGLLAGATLTSAVSTGTSLGATMNAKKLAEKMSSCNSKVSELKIAKNVLEAELEEVAEKPTVIFTAQNIIASCTGFDEGNIKTLKNMMTGSTIASYVGTAAAGVGTVASFMANSDKVRNYDDEKGKAKEKRLNTMANVTAGIATGTSATSTTLSAISLTKVKKDSETAEKCESAL